MRRAVGESALLLAVALVLAVPGPARAARCPDCLRAGAASVALTIVDGTPLAGYGRPARRLLVPDLLDRYPHAFWFRPHEGQLDPLGARALVLESGGTRLVWITADLVAVDRAFTDEVRRRLARAGGGEATVIISASHTHSGPGAFIDSRLLAFVAVDRLDRGVRDALAESLVSAARRAEAALTPARVGTASVEGPAVTTSRLRQPVDRNLVVMKVAAVGGRPLALVWNFAIHGTMLGPRNASLSGDVTGMASNALERELGVPVLYVNGAVGDVSPRGHGQVAAARAAAQLAAATRAAWAGIQPRDDRRLALRTARVALPAPSLSIRNCTARWIPRILALPLGVGLPRDTTLTAATAGDAAWVTIPGELQSRLGVEVKQAGAVDGRHAFVAGLSNDYLGYFVTATDYERVTYVTCASIYGPQAGERLAAAASDLLRGLLGDQR